MKGKMYNWQMALIACILVIAIVNLLIGIRLFGDMRKIQSDAPSRQSLPCGAIPTQFVMDDPECADRLLKSMNITNVHILSRGTS